MEEISPGGELEATFQDPLLLTVAAARPRTRYLEDEGYTFTEDPEGVLRLATDTAGDLGITIGLEGAWYVTTADYAEPVIIRHTTSDGLVALFAISDEVSVELRFVAATSRVAVAEVVLRSTAGRPLEGSLVPWLRRCHSGRYEDPLPHEAGVRMTHAVDVDFRLEVIGPGTYLEELAGVLAAPGRTPERVGLEHCGELAARDARALGDLPPLPRHRAAVAGLIVPFELPARGARVIRIYRGVVALDRAAELDDELLAAQELSPAGLLEEGRARLAAIPALPGLGRDAALVYRSAYTLLDQLMMPAEGGCDRDYYLFSREPTWWFARLGQHLHESLAMIPMAGFDPEAAQSSHRVFMDHLGHEGYLPYSVGPVVEQTALGTASAPLFSYIAWDIARQTGDGSFLADAYEAGSRIHGFWVDRRDADGDGLAEWGGYGITESVRDLENVIWVNVAPPEEVEAIALNTFLVKDASILAEMADALDRPSEAAGWRLLAEERAALINAHMWDEETGFYYHVTRDGNTFDYAEPGDLKRMEIAGLLPLWGGFVPPHRRAILLERMTDPERFWRASGIASLAADDPYYDPAASQCCRWRGPVWVQWQFLMMRALLEMGEHDLAVELTRRVLEAVAEQLSREHQLRELYDADDPAAPNHSMPNYIWSALVAQMMRETAQHADP